MAINNDLSCFETTQNLVCSKPSVALLVIVGLAIGILGALALVGHIYPSSPLASLSNVFGPVGGGILLGAGGMFALMNIVFRMCCYHKKSKKEDGFSYQPPLSAADKGQTGQTTGAPSTPTFRPSGHSNASFD